MAKTSATFRLNLTGQRFGRWLVGDRAERKGRHGEVYWWCRCDCGAHREVQASGLRNGKNTSCGCASRDRTTKHGMERTATYTCWAQMKARCQNPKHASYPGYGGRGIAVCDRWQDFPAFYADMGEKPEGMALDRIDNDGDYEPGNCRWADQKTQIRNRGVSPRVEYEGREWSLAELCEAKGLKWRRIYGRIRSGMPLERALSPGRLNRWS